MGSARFVLPPPVQIKPYIQTGNVHILEKVRLLESGVNDGRTNSHAVLLLVNNWLATKALVQLLEISHRSQLHAKCCSFKIVAINVNDVLEQNTVVVIILPK